MAHKAGIEQHEDTPRGMSDPEKAEIAAKHGDRALAIIGDERISLTEEDVRQLFEYVATTTDMSSRTNASGARPTGSSSPS